jgi:serine/threonine protein kinase
MHRKLYYDLLIVGDLKPANIFLDGSEKEGYILKIGDFVDLKSTTSFSGSFVGTPYYAGILNFKKIHI